MRNFGFFICILGLLNCELIRAAHPAKEVKNGKFSIPLKLASNGFYYGTVGIGTPPQTFNVFFDPTVPSVWVPSSKCNKQKYPFCKNHTAYDADKSSSETQTRGAREVNPFMEKVSGNVTLDQIKLDDQKYFEQAFIEADKIEGSGLLDAEFDGIIGLRKNEGDQTYPTILESMKRVGVIQKFIYSMYLTNGSGSEITFGGVNENKHTGNVSYTKTVNIRMWEFIADRFDFGGTNLCKSECHAIVNIGSFHITGPTEQTRIVNKALGCSLDAEPCTLDCSKINTFPNFRITVNGTEFVLNAKDYITKSGSVCKSVIVSRGLQYWSLGNNFLRKVYTVYNIDDEKIGFAHPKAFGFGLVNRCEKAVFPLLLAVLFYPLLG